jgi:hypothetical protein
MKKKLLPLIIIFFISVCANAQVVINEITPDPGNYDGQGGEWTELYNTSATPLDLSCWVLTDGEEIVVFPSGTYIPANGYLVIYNNNFFNCTTCNWDPAISNLLDNVGSVLSPDPDGVTSVNTATCGCTNQTGCFSVTWENPNSDNGTDRIVLFDASASIKDAVYYGIGDNYAAAASAILESVYATGPNTANHNITGAAAGCNLPAVNNYDIPALPALAGTSNATWKYMGGTITGCTTSKARSTNGGAAWINDLWPTPGANNANPNYKVTFTLNGGAPVDISSTDNTVINICNASTISFNGEVYDFNQVYNNNTGDAGNLEGGSVRGGSHVVATGGLTFDNTWNEAAVTATGLTALSYPTTAAITSNTVFKIYIKENTQGAGNINLNTTCPAAGTYIVGQGSATECYVLKTVTVNVIAPITSASFTCSSGFVKVTTVPAIANGLTYNLINSVTPALNQTNTTGQFQVTSGNAADYSLQVVQNPACTAPITATGTVCVFAPVCPAFTAYDACATAAGAVCPGTAINLSLTGTNLPNGGKIEWVNDTNNDGNVYDEAPSAVVAAQDITLAGAIPSGSPKLNEVIFDATIESGTTFGEGWEVAGTPGTNIGCSYFTDGDFVVQLPSTAVIPASGFYVVGTNNSSATWSSFNNLTLTSTSVIPNLTNGGEFLSYFNASNVFVNGTQWGAPAGGNAPATSALPTVSIVGAGCSLPTFAVVQAAIVANAASFPAPTSITGTGNEISIELAADLGTTWQVSSAPGSTVNTMGSSNAGLVSTLSPACVAYTVPGNACNTTLNLKPRISPAQTGCTPGSSTPTLATKIFTITCPTATISGQKAICSGASTSFDVNLANFGSNTTATVAYSINGVAQIPVPLTIAGNKVTVTGINTPGVITLTSVIFSGGAAICNGSVSGDVTIAVNTNPAAPTGTPVSVCSGKTTPLTVTGGGPAYNWYSDAALTNLIGAGNPYYYTGSSTTLYTQSVDPDNGCVSAGTAVAVTTTIPPALTIPASVNCTDGTVIQVATGGTPALTYTLAGKTGIGGNAIGTNNITGIFNLSGCSGATILVADVNGCYDIVTYDFLAAPYNCSGTLALTFENFSVQKRNETAVITWAISDDKDINNYEIERSSDAVHFNSIGSIASKKLGAATYFFTDNTPAGNKNYYRIKAIAVAGTIKYTAIRYLVFVKGFEINVTPNPASNQFEIITNSDAVKQISISDAKGSPYYSQQNNLSNIIVNCSNWASGIYLLKINNIATGEVVTKKIIIK